MIRVFDDVLSDPHAYRRQALAQKFGDVTLGPDTFRGIAMCPDPALTVALIGRLPMGVETTLTFFRRSPRGQAEPNFIHSDEDMGDWTGIYYLNPLPADGDGTTFWEHAGSSRGPWTPDVDASARERVGWNPWRHVPARFNRAVVFRSDLFHSRAIEANYGAGESARLVQVVFGRGGIQ